MSEPVKPTYAQFLRNSCRSHKNRRKRSPSPLLVHIRRDNSSDEGLIKNILQQSRIALQKHKESVSKSKRKRAHHDGDSNSDEIWRQSRIALQEQIASDFEGKSKLAHHDGDSNSDEIRRQSRIALQEEIASDFEGKSKRARGDGNRQSTQTQMPTPPVGNEAVELSVEKAGVEAPEPCSIVQHGWQQTVYDESTRASWFDGTLEPLSQGLEPEDQRVTNAKLVPRFSKTEQSEQAHLLSPEPQHIGQPVQVQILSDAQVMDWWHNSFMPLFEEKD